MASVFTLEGPSLASVPRTMMPAFVQRQPRLLNGPSEYVQPLNGAGDSLGSASQWPQLLQGIEAHVHQSDRGYDRRRYRNCEKFAALVASGHVTKAQYLAAGCVPASTPMHGFDSESQWPQLLHLRGPSGLELLGLPPTVATIAGFAAAAAVGIALGTGAVWAHKKLTKKGGLSGALGFSKPRRRRKRR